MATTKKTNNTIQYDKIGKKGYTESSDYFPKDLRKKYGIGEFEKKTTKGKTSKKK